MSGVASMGSLVKLQPPSTMSANVSTSISQRWRMENAMSVSSMIALLVLVFGGRFADVRLDQEALRDHDLLAGRQADGDIGVVRIAPPQRHRALLVAFALAHVY